MNVTDIKRFLSDEDAVSPVIGVILMVAITVILAAVIGTFVLGLGDQVQSSAPNANFQFEYDAANGDGHDGDTGVVGTGDTVIITHNGGQDVDADNVEVQTSSGLTEESAFPTTIDTGSQAIYSGTVGGETVRVIWTSDSGGSSNTIGQSTVPS